MSWRGAPRHFGDRRPLRRVLSSEAGTVQKETDVGIRKSKVTYLDLECGHRVVASSKREGATARCDKCPPKPLEVSDD